MFRPHSLLSLLFSLSLVSPFVQATPIIVDGDLSDWGISVADGTSSKKVGSDYSGLRTDLAGSMIEDTNDISNSYKVTPYYGGQNYDGEFFGAMVTSNTLYLAILSGQRADNGFNKFAPGDIRIKSDMGVFGIEVGGGAGTKYALGETPTTAAIGLGESGSTYGLDSNGYTKSHTVSTKQTGSVWLDADWIQDPFSNSISTDVQLKDGTGTKAGDSSEFVHTLNSYTNQHSVIELAIDLDVFGGAMLEEFYWSPSCSNDRLKFETNISTVPAPATLVLLGLGLFGLIFSRRNK